MAGRIILNALPATLHGAGVSRYTLGLARALLARRNDVRAVVQQSMVGAFDAGRGHLIVCPDQSGTGERILTEQLSLPTLARDAALIHYPDHMISMRAKAPAVMTIHDVCFLRRPKDFGPLRRTWKRFITRRSVRKAWRVICDSDYTLSEARHFLDLPDDRVRRIYPGLTPIDAEPVPPRAVAGDTPFIVAVGTVEPRKNLVRLVEALAMLEDRDLRLVLAGARGAHAEVVSQVAQAKGVADRVLFCGRCTDGELAWLYGHAAALAYVSLDEGFGYPPLEAMAAGCPVVAARAGSVPEVCGEAAHYVDPESVEDMARGLSEVAAHDGVRADLVGLGRERAAAFDWATTADAVSDLYDELIG